MVQVNGFQQPGLRFVSPAGGLAGFRRQGMDQQKKSAYAPPVLLQTGALAGASFASAPYGYDINPGNNPGGNSTFWYLNKDLKLAVGQTKFYWELDHIFVPLNDNALMGIMANPTVSQTYMGYSSANAGVYNNGNYWFEAGWGGAWSGPLSALVAGAIMGIAYDSAARTLSIYENGVLAGQITFNVGQPPAVYPGMTWQGNMTGSSIKLRLGPGNTNYSPPYGYDYL